MKNKTRRCMRKVTSIAAAAMCFVMLFAGPAAKASETAMPETGFSVAAVIPENQTDESKSYFDLQMEPGQEQELEVQMSNSSSEEIVVAAEISSATTNTNGVVEYGKRDIEVDSTLEYNMEDIISVEEEITLAPNSTYTLKLNVKMPEEEFDGVLAGGITMSEVIEEEEEDEEEVAQMSIENRYAYVIGIVLRENDNEIEPELVLNDVYANQINARNVISANLQNTRPMYMNQLEVEADITEKGSEEVLYSAEKAQMQMAPNSNFNFPVSLNGARMKAGEYTIHMTARSMGEEWTWSKDFTITADEAKEFNENDVTIEDEDYTWIYIAVGAAILLLVIIIVIVVRNKKKTAKLKAELEKALADKE